MRLSPNFVLSEFTRSDKAVELGIRNRHGRVELAATQCLVGAVLQPWRERVGRLQVSSGLRVLALNRAIGSKDSSQHRRGEAADVEPLDMPLDEALQILWDMTQAGLPLDQAIEYGVRGYVHVSHTARRINRRQLRYDPEDGSDKRLLWWTPNGPRTRRPR